MDAIPELGAAIETGQTYLDILISWLQANAFVMSNAAQVVIVLVAFVIAKVLDKPAMRLVKKAERGPFAESYLRTLLHNLASLTLPVMWLIVQWLSISIAARAGWPTHLLTGVVSLLTAWVIIRLMTSVVGHAGWSRAIALGAWTVAALNIVGWLTPTMAFLDDLALNLGDLRISVLGLIKAAIALAVLLWAAGWASKLAENRLRQTRNLTPSAQVLFGKLLRIGLFVLAVVVGLNSVGIDLTAFAVFSGALGLGIGFGLQKVVANLISGIILLLDRSVKPGDVIAVGDSFGWINALRARYVSVITRDGTEHLIPNEELISQRVENWSYTDKLVRLKLPVGISYDSDPRRAAELAVAAAEGVDRVLAHPKPVCHLRGFGDSALNLEMRVWIQDPQNGVANVTNQVLLRLWDAFQEGGIDFPYPQHDVHIKSGWPTAAVSAPKTGD